MAAPQEDELLALIELFASHYGYYDGKIDLESGDLSTFATPECSITAHAPLWRTKEGQEKQVPLLDVRKQLAGMLKWFRIRRHEMHLAQHPTQNALCLFFVVKSRLAFLPFNLMTVPLAFVVTTRETPDGLRLDEIHEWPAEDPVAARAVLIDECGWPTETAFEPHPAFGAAS